MIPVGSNKDAAKLMGINMGKIKILVFMLSGVLYIIMGVTLASRDEVAVPKVGNTYKMNTITATIVGRANISGGKRGIVGTVFGAILMATIKNGSNLLSMNTFWHQAVVGILILLAVALDGYASSRVARDR